MDPNKMEIEEADSDTSSEFKLLSSSSDSPSSSDFRILSSSSDSSSSDYECTENRGKSEPRETVKSRSFKLKRMPGLLPNCTKVTTGSEAKTENSQKPARMLTKRRSFKPIKKSVVEAATETPESTVKRATCSSALKDSKLRRKIELKQQRGETESQVSDMKVCRYTYCSLHGHRHVNTQPLKRFVSMRRRTLKNQKSIKSENRSVTKVNRSGNRKKKSTDKKENKPVIAVHHDESNGDGLPEVENSIQQEVNGEDAESRKEKQKSGGLWGLIYKHMKSGVAFETEMEKEEQGNDNRISPRMNDSLSRLDSSITDQESRIGDDNQKLELLKGDAVKLVQEAFDKILSEIPDQSSDDQSICSDSTLEQWSIIQDFEEKQVEAVNVDTSTSEEQRGLSKEGKKSSQNVLKNWSNLRKAIMVKRFVNALENVRKINEWRKPRYLSVETEEEDEKIKLRRQMMGQGKNTDEWMLDYALRKVVSQLAPVQKRKVAMLVQAFETLSPSTDIVAPKRFSATDFDNMDKDSGLTDDDRSDSVDSFLVSKLEQTNAHCTNCCLHGHLHSSLQPVTRVVSMRWSSFKTPKMSRLSSRRKRNTKQQETENVASGADSRDAKPAVTIGCNESKKNGQRIVDSAVDDRLQEGLSPSVEPMEKCSSTDESHKTDTKKHVHTGLWGLLYKRMASSIAEEAGEEKQRQSDSKEEEEEIFDDQSKGDAVRIVKEAFDKILSEIPDSSSDDQSVSSDITSEQENIEQHHPDEQRMEPHNISATGKERGLTEGKKSSQNALKNWSNMRKIVMFRRFVKAVEKVKNVKSWKPPRHLPMGAEAETEKVNLRSQSVGQGKKSDEWMLDYALRQVISELAPAQKRKVALLVQAFETVSPVPEVTTTKSLRSNATESDDGDNNSVISDCMLDSVDFLSSYKLEEPGFSKKPFLKPNDSRNTSSEGLLKTLQKSFTEVISNDEPVACDRDMKFNVERLDLIDAMYLKNYPEKEDSGFSKKPSPETCETKSSKFSWGSLDIGSSIKPKTSTLEKNRKSLTNLEASPVEEFKPNASGNVRQESKWENNKFKGLWFLLHKHMESTSAEGGTQEVHESENKGAESREDVSETNQKILTDESDEEVDAIKLIEKAIDEINIPEGQEDLPDDRSVKSNNEDVEGAETASESGGKGKPRMQKNWSNLKRVILLNRFIKSLEKVEKIKTRGPRYLPSDPVREAEKVNLRKSTGDKRYEDDWMLDHALQEVVSKLTPARKRKVELLIEAFETVTPTN